ncbi:GNAT family N-acetyltransferase [Flexivirga caeni]|uniref:GNAT family N-acetyltransferase n=1 Tax=Flexivirga caeni TaxID=2294115 RepID=A0A3M9MKA3_9MICO|nr:GNAT family N-acetyltransferase [Flexivirga caeni]RNI25313.1 GNAT family N-acetyltransferase [Flexivirga caeni]
MIRLIDPFDERDMRQVYDIGVAAKGFARPWFSPSPYNSWAVGMRDPDPEEPRELYGCFDAAGRMTGTSLLFVPAQDNRDKVYADVDVQPADRRRGFGTQLVRHAVARMEQLGRTTLFIESSTPAADGKDHGYARFARSLGFAPAWREVVRHLPLPVPDDRLARLAADAAGRHAGYRILTYAGGVPEELLPGLADLMSLLAVDAPSGDVEFEAEVITPERLAHTYAREAKQQRIRLSALAIHEATGVVAAHTDLAFDSTASVAQLGTYVHREHRGHRLGMAVKVANLQLLQRDHPGHPFVHTANEENNEHMVSINIELGFEAVETLTEWTIDIGKS